ncbi:MAG TPA: rod shape-determining protein MreC [Candidatus Limnocylindrales bacterium]|nr:rod shape-determining protein MreC [Candidatus Limnocylindrales bacterium]
MSRAARRQTALYVFLVAFTLILVAFSNSGPLLELRRGVGFALSPIQDTLRQGTRTVTSLFATIGEIEELRQTNEELSQRLQAVEADNQRLLSLAAENEQLADLLGVRSSIGYETVASEVIGRRTTEQERVISIDAGTDVGVNVDDPVVAGGGALIGRVVEVGPNFARILLINDTRMNVAGLVETTRAIGDVQGNGERPLQMTRIPATDTVNVGDAVVTAGIELEGGIRSTYPKGLLIGTIASIQRQPDQLFQTALVQPVAGLDRLEYVLVIINYEGGPSAESPLPSGSAAASPVGSPAVTVAPPTAVPTAFPTLAPTT